MTNFFKIFTILFFMLFASVITAKLCQPDFSDSKSINDAVDLLKNQLNENAKSSEMLYYSVGSIAIKQDELILVSILENGYYEDNIKKFNNVDTTFYSCFKSNYFSDLKFNKIDYKQHNKSVWHYLRLRDYTFLSTWFKF